MHRKYISSFQFFHQPFGQFGKLMSLMVIGFVFSNAQLGFAKEYKIDSVHSNVRFTVRHLVSKMSGEFKDIEGKISFDPSKPEKSKVSAVVKVDSVNTNQPKRDEHLKSKDFFSADEFPTFKFESKKITAQGEKKFKMSGDLTLRGITKPVDFKVEYLGTSKDPQGHTVVGFSAETEINRKDFEISWNKKLDSGGWVISEEVSLKIDIEASAE